MKGRISRNFTWGEMLASRKAKREGICNVPGAEEVEALEHLVKRVLQPLRLAYGKPIRISSGYRCAELNRLVGGVPSSQHVKGEAADCVVEDAEELLKVLLEGKFPFDQAILYKKRNFLHVSLRRWKKNREKVIIND